MATKKLTREQCERMILAKLKEIEDIHKMYNPDADYLSLTIYSKDKHYGANNRYYGEDKEAPIDFYDVGEGI